MTDEYMNVEGKTNDDTPPVVLAVLGGLLCLPIIRILTNPVGRFVNARLAEWVILGTFVLVPMAVAFVILYRSSWHREYSRLRRVVSVLLSSCAVYFVDLVVAGVLLLIASLMIALTRSVGGN